MFLNKISNRRIIKYLNKQTYFKTAIEIATDLKVNPADFAEFDIQLKSLAASHKLLIVPFEGIYKYSRPVKTKTGRLLSGLLYTNDYLLLSCALGDETSG